MTDLHDLIWRKPEPPNAETPLARQEGLLTPTERFYVRCNFPLPAPPAGLTVAGLVARDLPAVELAQFHRRRLIATLECAGNGRAFLDPATPGEQWELGAVSTAEWAGVSLADVLAAAGGVLAEATEVVFEAADGYARSLPVATALSPTILLATHMNGEPLTPVHGAPLRLLVPRWYGMASVKWLTRVTAVAEPFAGHFQVEKYVIEGLPVREMAVRAVVTAADAVGVRGYAWTGHGSIAGVTVSVDGGLPLAARLEGADEAGPYGWVRWILPWSPEPGRRTVIARARDTKGNEQPPAPRWNALGYANNAARPATVTIP